MIVSVVVLIAAALIYGRNIWGMRDKIDSITIGNKLVFTYSSVSMEVLTQRTIDYVGKGIIVTGRLKLGTFPNPNYELVDDAGHTIYLGEKCIDQGKAYVYVDSPSHPVYYTAKGLFTSERMIMCNSPIE